MWGEVATMLWLVIMGTKEQRLAADPSGTKEKNPVSA